MTATKEQQRFLDYLCEKYDLALKTGNQIIQLEAVDRLLLLNKEHPGIIPQEKVERLRQLSEEILKNL